MTDRLLRHIPSGVLWVYQPAFATRPDFEEVIDVPVVEVADNGTADATEAAAPTVGKKKKKSREELAAEAATAVAEAVAAADAPVAIAADLTAEIDEALSEQASRGL